MVKSMFTNYRIYSANTVARQLHRFRVVTKLAADAVGVEVYFRLWTQRRWTIEFSFILAKERSTPYVLLIFEKQLFFVLYLPFQWRAHVDCVTLLLTPKMPPCTACHMCIGTLLVHSCICSLVCRLSFRSFDGHVTLINHRFNVTWNGVCDAALDCRQALPPPAQTDYPPSAATLSRPDWQSDCYSYPDSVLTYK